MDGISLMGVGALVLVLSATGYVEMGFWGHAVCISFIGCGVVALHKLRRISRALKSELLKDPRVVQFYQDTKSAWASDEFAKINWSLHDLGKLSYKDFVRKCPPVEGGPLQVMFTQFPPLPDEYLAAVPGTQSTANLGWFILTSQRLILQANPAGPIRDFLLADIDSFEAQGTWTKTVVLRMKSGWVTTLDEVDSFPGANYLNEAISKPKLMQAGTEAG